MAFIRTSPSGSQYGGVHSAAFETILLCEAAGYDLVLVETVGIGQSEVDVQYLVDLLIHLVQPGSGDEWQGIKRGIMEVADLWVVPKHDGTLRQAAENSVAMLQILAHDRGGAPKALLCSAVENRGIAQLWEVIAAAIAAKDRLTSRQERSAFWLVERIKGEVWMRFWEQNEGWANALKAQVSTGELSFGQAILLFGNRLSDES